MNGVLVVDKPVGPTSHDVVARVRRATAIRRVGHTGTLDPLATGVLPLVIGSATRLASLLSAGDKAYDASVRLGAATDTYDAAGRIVASDGTSRGSPASAEPPPPPPAIDRETVDAALRGFRGDLWQTPPAFSAKKIDGVRAYALARRRIPVEPRPVRVTVSRLDVIDYREGRLDVRLVCSAGFYVRSFAHDLGVQLGGGAYLERLRRTRSGDFTLEGAAPLDTIEREGPAALARLVPLHLLLPRLPRVILTERGARRAAHGNSVGDEDVVERPSSDDEEGATAGAARVRLFDSQGALLAIAEPEPGRLLHPLVVLV
jgi:tRNA pseudouridine55 synthase